MKRRASTVIAAVLSVLSVQVGATAAATDTPVASDTALGGRVVIRCAFAATGPFPVDWSSTCSIRGAITDRGKFVGQPFPDLGDRILLARKGIIDVVVTTGRWAITGGTKAYADLRGRGTASWYRPCPHPVGCRRATLTMTGTVSS